MTRRIACLTLDVEYDYHDLVAQRHSDALDHEPIWAWLTGLGRERGIPLTAFVVGELLEQRPDVAAKLAMTGWELGLHAYSHNPERTDTLDEIQRGKAAFRTAFGQNPSGYRAPLGKITPPGLQRLLAEGFLYDSSLFPAFRPGTFNNLRCPLEPHIVSPQNGNGPPLVEIPCAVLRGLRIIVSVSYMRLLGLPFYQMALPLLGLPDVVVIDCHLHDLAPSPAAVRQLPPFWRFVYQRNAGRGTLMLEWLIEYLTQRGYRFTSMEHVARLVLGEKA